MKKLCIFIILTVLVISCTKDTDDRSLTDTLSTQLAVQQIVNNDLTTELKVQKEMLKILLCESGFDHDGIGDGGLARGVAQFHEKTFYSLCNKKDHQLQVLQWAIENGYSKLWSCSTIAKQKKRGKR